MQNSITLILLLIVVLENGFSVPTIHTVENIMDLTDNLMEVLH